MTRTNSYRQWPHQQHPEFRQTTTGPGHVDKNRQHTIDHGNGWEPTQQDNARNKTMHTTRQCNKTAQQDNKTRQHIKTMYCTWCDSDPCHQVTYHDLLHGSGILILRDATWGIKKLWLTNRNKIMLAIYKFIICFHTFIIWSHTDLLHHQNITKNKQESWQLVMPLRHSFRCFRSHHIQTNYNGWCHCYYSSFVPSYFPPMGFHMHTAVWDKYYKRNWQNSMLFSPQFCSPLYQSRW